ncbi:MAG: threonylcarbamoyl-AMP synthase, partial [Ilumatobacteraceae bacterium]|nr:threonylcarbamoyl-AMP synthase [Ilumatobacteraceae bacterium]
MRRWSSSTRRRAEVAHRFVSTESDEVERALDILRAGGLVGLPTETVYGLAGDATNEAAVRRIFAAKGRPADHPLIVHIED